ncbi:MAG: hypothetical protein KDH97_01505 [Calditrichaeota bacterium]|nr:hypothetical protein [Calditrichota bacterium]MCB0288905.1 hypothetical protein [Calditrichota bacterium]MCB0288908.1 hypothetical protein [Calditrichota bacterium]MCB0303401.1 hypothetical protein [Calditrichota bacterium]
MSIKIKLNDGIMILRLNEIYTIHTIKEVIDFAESKEYQLQNVEHIIIDCEALQYFEDGGGELFLLRKNKHLKDFLFSGLDESLKPIMDIFSQDWFGETIVNFPTEDAAIKFIKEKDSKLPSI